MKKFLILFLLLLTATSCYYEPLYVDPYCYEVDVYDGYGYYLYTEWDCF